jgi:hypothetical protein
MKKAVDKLKWFSVSVTVAALVMVFWVWPAWDRGSQTWYWGNNPQDSINIMYRNHYPPSEYSGSFEFDGRFDGAFMANEAAAQMLTFRPDSWQYQIEWYGTSMMTVMDPVVSFTLTIGKWSGMGAMMTLVPYFSAMGDVPSPLGHLITKTGNAMFSSMMGNLMFMHGEFLGATLMLMTSPSSFHVVVPVAKTCYITSPLSDPGYPGGGLSVPTLSQWGTLVMAILVSFLYFVVIRRRVKKGSS